MMTTTIEKVGGSPIERLPEPDELVRATMIWHFSPETGSPYWLSRVPALGFNPLRDVRGMADLRLFDQVSVDWRSTPAEQFIPRGCEALRSEFGVWETGGTTGAPKRIVEGSWMLPGAQRVNTALDAHGFPVGDGNWLYLGPSGPHAIGKYMRMIAAMRHALCYYVDLDPRWVKKCIADQYHDVLRRYVDHILDQAKDVLVSQNITTIATTPPLLTALAARSDTRALMRDKARAILWVGASATAETLRVLEKEAYPDATLVGLYGNTMMEMAPQRPRRLSDPSPCIFTPPYPYTVIDVVDLDDSSQSVKEDGPGQVKVGILTKEMFIPPRLERDAATKRAPMEGQKGVDLSDVRPLETVDGRTVIEGVY